jgi:hypothetical protein
VHVLLEAPWPMMHVQVSPEPRVPVVPEAPWPMMHVLAALKFPPQQEGGLASQRIVLLMGDIPALALLWHWPWETADGLLGLAEHLALYVLSGLHCAQPALAPASSMA